MLSEPLLKISGLVGGDPVFQHGSVLPAAEDDSLSILRSGVVLDQIMDGLAELVNLGVTVVRACSPQERETDNRSGCDLPVQESFVVPQRFCPPACRDFA